MFKTSFALALCLALTTASASAQGPSYESRGYGGPLYIGPNFHEGGQYTPPSYGPKSSTEQRYAPKGERTVTKSHKAPTTRETDTEKSSSPTEAASIVKPELENSTISSASGQTDNTKTTSPAATPSSIDKSADTENSTISSASLQTDHTDAGASPKAEAAVASPATCKRFIAAAGKTVTVPCDQQR